MDPQNIKKTFWEKPEGKTGMLFAAGGIAGFLLIMAKFGPLLVEAAKNTLVLGGYVLTASAIGYILMDKRFRATIGLAYKGLMRFITGLFIQLDPIAILKSYVDDLKDSLGKMDSHIGKLKGAIAALKLRISQNEKEMQNNMSLASQAKKQGLKAQMILKTKKAGRLQESNRTYQDLLKKMEILYRVLAKMYENCSLLIEDTEDQIEQKETEWKMIRQAHSAMRSAMSVINGDKDKRAIFEEALEYMANDLGNKIGEMERFMDLSQNFMDGVDLQNGTFEEKGMQMLEQWEQNADSWLLGDEKKQIIAEANSSLDITGTVRKSDNSSNQFSSLFE